MTSCQVCYEEYSNDSTLTCARKLNCGHFLCRKCLQNDFVDDSYCCPECFTILEGSTIDVISISISTEEIQQQNQSAIIPTEYIDDDNNTSGEFEDEEDDGSNHNNINNPIDSYFQRGICSYPGCQNREIEGNLCLRHGDRQGDFSEADRIASDLRNAKFHMKTNEANIIEPTVCLDLQPDDLRERFSMQKRIELGEAMELIDRARDVMATEPNIISLQAPLLAVGDIHGQYFDLLNMIEQGGIPGVEEQYLFLGDYVDRGSFSCEVMFFLLSLKVAYPTKVWLLRGNHECATVSGHFGFKKECKMKYGMNVYYKFLLLFQSMPLAAVISTSYGDVFACHGGISPSFQTLDEIEKLNRFVEPETDPALLDILWSDPVSDEEVDGMSDDQFQEFLNLDWKTNTSRGCSYTYGYKAIRRFLDTNNLVCIVRAHEVQEDGYKKHFDPSVVEERIKRLIAKRAQDGLSGKDRDNEISIGDASFPPLLTIFSAPNYCDKYQNKAAILRISCDLDGFHAIQYDCVVHPEPEIVASQTDNYILAIICACPYMPTSLRKFVQMAVDLGPDLAQSQNEWISSSPFASRQNSTANTGNESTPTSASVSALNVKKNNTKGDFIPPPDAEIGSNSTVYSNATTRPESKGASRRTSRHEAFEAARLALSRIEMHPKIMPFASMVPSQELSIEVQDEKEEVKFVLAALQGIKSSLASTSTTSGASSTTPLGSPPRRRSGSHSGVLSPSRTGAGIKDISPSRLRLANKQKAMESYAGRTRSTSLEDAVSPLKQSIRSQAIADRLSDLSRGRSVPVKLSANTLTPLHLERVSDRVVRISKPQPETNDDSRESEPTTEPNTGRSSVDGPGEANRSLFDEKEILGLKLMFSLFDRSGSNTITYDDLIAYGEETGDLSSIRDAGRALDVVDVDGDGKIGLVDFIRFATRLKARWGREQYQPLLNSSD